MAALQVRSRISKLVSRPLPCWWRICRLSSSSLEDAGGVRGRFDDDGDKNSRRNSHQQRPPEPIPNRPLRGPANPKFDNNRRLSAANNKADFEFLDKLKLGVGAKQESKEEKEGEVKAETSPSPPPPPQEAEEIFRKLKETGLIPNAVAMLDGLCKDGLVQEAMKLFGLMREKGTIPEVVIYTAVVEGFCKAQKFDDAKRIFRKMQSNGISPNAVSYSVLIQGFYQCDHLDDAVAFCVEMLEAGHSPNVQTFLGLVTRLCSSKGVEEARSVIATLTQKGFFINNKAIKEYVEKKPAHPHVWEAIFGNETQEKPFRF
jgi:pentatricopeptide repeat protein